MARDQILGLATVAVLRAIENGHSYGLDIVEDSGRPSGTVYPTLSRLERRGYVKSRWERQQLADRAGRPRRRYYELTPAGQHALSRAVRQYQLLAESATRSEGA